MGFIQAFEMLAGTALRLEVTIETQAGTGSRPSRPWIGQSDAVLSNPEPRALFRPLHSAAAATSA